MSPVSVRQEDGGYVAPSTSPASGGGASASPGGSGSNVIAAAAGFGTGEITVERKTADRAVNAPDYNILPGWTVYVKAKPTNTVNVSVSTKSPEHAKAGKAIVFTNSGVPQRLSVRNLNELWVYSSVVGEGVEIGVLRT